MNIEVPHLVESFGRMERWKTRARKPRPYWKCPQCGWLERAYETARPLYKKHCLRCNTRTGRQYPLPTMVWHGPKGAVTESLAQAVVCNLLEVRIKAAAVCVNGRVYTGRTHSEARQAALATDFHHPNDVAAGESGFVTDAGDFVDANVAYAIATGKPYGHGQLDSADLVKKTRRQRHTCPDCYGETYQKGKWRTGRCDDCRGTGQIGPKECSNCQGTGSPICCRCEGTGVDPIHEGRTQNRYNPKGLRRDRSGILRDKWGRAMQVDWDEFEKRRVKRKDVIKPYPPGQQNPLHNATTTMHEGLGSKLASLWNTFKATTGIGHDEYGLGKNTEKGWKPKFDPPSVKEIIRKNRRRKQPPPEDPKTWDIS